MTVTRQNVSRYFNQLMQIYKISILIFCREYLFYLFYFCENTWLLDVEKVVVEYLEGQTKSPLDSYSSPAFYRH